MRDFARVQVETAIDGKTSTAQVLDLAGVLTENIVVITHVQLVVLSQYIQAAVLVLCIVHAHVMIETHFTLIQEDTLEFRVADVTIQASMDTISDHQSLMLTQDLNSLAVQVVTVKHLHQAAAVVDVWVIVGQRTQVWAELEFM